MSALCVESVPRVLLLTGTVPGAQDVGGLYLQAALEHVPQERICCAALCDGQHDSTRAPTAGLSLHVETAPFDSGAAWDAGFLARARAHGRFRMARSVGLAGLARRVARFGRAQEVELVWAVLNRPLLARLATLVADRLNVPLVTTIWDPPESICRNERLDSTSAALACRDFEAAMRTAIRSGVMSETMAAEYGRRFGARTIVMRHGIAPASCQPVATQPNDDGWVTIGFSGQLYAVQEWDALMAALDGAGWRVAGRRVRVRVLSGQFAARAPTARCIEWLGWRPMDETIALLAESDVNYLPYWFHPGRRTAVRLCFPGKMTAYAAAGRPVLFHGPRDSSVMAFFERYPCGIGCCSLEAGEILRSLEALLVPSSYGTAAAAIERARTEALSERTFVEGLAQLVGGD